MKISISFFHFFLHNAWASFRNDTGTRSLASSKSIVELVKISNLLKSTPTMI